MDAALTLAPEKQTGCSPRERRCLVTGEVLPKDMLLRFVVGPEATLVADLAQTLPGRGMWVKPEAEVIAEAARKNLFAKSAKTKIKIPTDLLPQITALLRQRCLDFLGLAKRSGIAVLGQPQVEAALKARKLSLLLLADDAQHSFAPGLVPPTVQILTRNELGAALGYEQLVYVGLMPHALTEKLAATFDRLGKLGANPHIPLETDSRTA